MFNSITDFIENSIHNLVEISEDFAKYPDKIAEFIEGIGKETNQLALNIIGETLTSRDLMIKESCERKEKRAVDYLYIDADEDHIALQFQQKKGDLSVNESGDKNNGVLGKLVYVYEG